MPETQSQEKIDFLRMIGADLRLVPGQAVPRSRQLRARLPPPGRGDGAETGNAIWANQFDNLANREGHRMTTGPEIWDQTGGKVDAFTCSCGTGGTLAGVSLALKERNPERPHRAGRSARAAACMAGSRATT